MIAKPNVEDLTTLGGLVAEGRLKPVVHYVYSLPETPESMA